VRDEKEEGGPVLHPETRKIPRKKKGTAHGNMERKKGSPKQANIT